MPLLMYAIMLLHVDNKTRGQQYTVVTTDNYMLRQLYAYNMVLLCPRAVTNVHNHTGTRL